jgi:hypothetical protein
MLQLSQELHKLNKQKSKDDLGKDIQEQTDEKKSDEEKRGLLKEIKHKWVQKRENKNYVTKEPRLRQEILKGEVYCCACQQNHRVDGHSQCIVCLAQ